MTLSQSPDNGVNVDALLGAREALEQTPEAGAFTWRATCNWVNGTHSYSEVESFFGLGEEQTHVKKYGFDADHPEVFASEDHGATPVEIVLVGLASCLTAGVAAVAQHREIRLNSVSATIEGDMDIAGILGADPDIRNGFSGIRVTYNIDADASGDDIEALVAQSQKRSAVFDIITNPTNVDVKVSAGWGIHNQFKLGVTQPRPFAVRKWIITAVINSRRPTATATLTLTTTARLEDR